MRVENVRTIELPVTLRCGVRFVAPEGYHGRTVRRMFPTWSTRLVLDHDELVVDGRGRGSRISTALDEICYVKVWNASPVPFRWAVVDVSMSDGSRLGLEVMGPRRLLAGLRTAGLELFTNPAWPRVYAAARHRADIEWSDG